MNPRFDTNLLPQQAVLHIDEVCNRFETAWKEGREPRIDDYLGNTPEPERAILLGELQALDREYRQRLALDTEVTRHPGPALETATDQAEGRAAPEPGAATISVRTLGPLPDAGDPFAPAIPGHEILEVLGRGGMGIVYKARHVRLKRLVALKMVLSGAHAHPDELARFRHEAEAAARLQHPNIVQIYEIGDSASVPYLSLELVDGGSLAQKLARTPQSADVCAALTETLARAIHYTHQRGVIHRDLKPANILIQEIGVNREEVEEKARPSSAHSSLLAPHSFLPKITDFGLAKQVEDQGQTRSGAILGTPSYMAPEQAEGRIKDISPRTDIYALGAILYEMLTGQPPFAAATTLETLRQVIGQDPVPPSRLQPRVPRDLETICLKAMAKLPGQRYSSAQALADDLSRFQAGENILARRTSPLVRLVRHVNRRRVMYGALVVLLSALALTGLLLLHGMQVSRADVLLKAIDHGLETDAWSVAHVESLEVPLQELARLDQDKGALARGRLYRRFGESIRETFSVARRPTLSSDDLQSLGHDIAFLGTRAPDLAKEIERDLEARLRKSQVMELSYPFADIDTFFAPGHVQIQDKALILAPREKQPPQRVFLKVPCQGKVEMTVVFEAWENAGSLSLSLNASQKSGYHFQVLPVARLRQDEPEAEPEPSTFAAAKRVSGMIRVRILRNDRVLREQELVATNVFGPLTLAVARDGYRLSAQVNLQAPVVFDDVFPLASAGPGAFALTCPAEARVRSVRIANQALPAVPSHLERGDMLYVESKYAEALAFYEQHEVVASATEAGQELRFKRGACLLALNRIEAAIPLLEGVAAADGARWPLLAGCQLWLVHYRLNRLADADALFLRLSSRYSVAALANTAPEEVRRGLFLIYTADFQGTAFVRFDDQRVARLERIAALADMLMVFNRRRLQIGLSLVRAYHFAGQLDNALATARKLLQDEALAGRGSQEQMNLSYTIRVLEEFGWLLRLRGTPAEALSEIDQRLYAKTGYREMYWPLWLERARIHVAQQQWQQAASDLELFFTGPRLYELPYGFYAEASLLLGFIRKRQGDEAGALAAWQRGIYSRWQEHAQKVQPGEKFAALTLEGTSFITHIVLASVTNQLQHEDTGAIVKTMVAQALGKLAVGSFQDVMQLPPPLLYRAWQSPVGMAAAEKMAIKSTTWPGYVESFPVVTGYTLILENALPKKVSPEQEKLVLDLCAEMWRRYHGTDSLTRDRLLSLALTWKGSTNILGWSGVAPRLEPSVRGPLAYVFGHRFRRLNNPDAALEFFRTAARDAAPGSTLASLAQREIEQQRK